MEKLRTIKELFNFLWERKLWWLIPMIFIFLVIGLLIVTIGSSPLAPIIYPLF
ncbi:MAG: hypothetical protein ACD_31C00005G0005 [uncultured bacterium]|uniref:Uncharacterized protein n=2 Tax=Candidatus Daviesiibacteriota TaxID=1752718 RepID=A0A0G0EPF4_9BACT|nr:MAG: hypothetical protein ACD_31C00005G0005 [uncultured bacterium]KKQ07387.1 MAG: hypothetical protein US19_C0047G0005 [Candidatus Daviesbacteria bacterium GW2011_GWB1_36_5]KKQ15709.1 MAG: hypothetical protein US28_C0011G0005 [Candidatus Daviesbacteria bacterium GW2011_GWA1_36_8]